MSKIRQHPVWFSLVVGLVGLSLVGLPVMYSGCQKEGPTAPPSGWQAEGQFQPDETPHFVAAKLAAEANQTTDPFEGIRVDGTELHPIYGYKEPDGKIVVGWATLEQAQAVADVARARWQTGLK